MASFRESFSPPTVGAYRIRPDVGEWEMMAASILSFFREHFPSLGVFAYVEGVCDTPLHFYYWLVGDAVMDGIVSCKFFAANCRGVSHTP